MLLKELKQNFKGLIIWTLIIGSLFIVQMSIYPSLMSGDTSEMINQMMAQMPQELLRAFNMDIISMDNMQSWLIAEGFLYMALIGSVYFAILGSTLILKEQDEGTISFLAVKPVSRRSIVTSKVIAGLINILIFNLIIGLILLVGFTIYGEINYIQLVLTIINPMILHIFIFAAALNLSLLYKKTTKAIMGGIGLVFILYILQVLSTLSENIEFLKYISPFYYTDSRPIIESSSLIWQHTLFIVVLSLAMFVSVHLLYNKKELS